MTERRHASMLVTHCCKNEQCTCRVVHCICFKEWNRKTVWKIHRKKIEGTQKQPLDVFDALVLSDLQNPRLCLQNVACKHTKGMRQSKQDIPGDKFPAECPHIPASPALLCPRAFLDWPVEWATQPDSNSVWQGDLETDVPCHWHGTENEMVSCVHTVYISMKTKGEKDRERNCMLELRVRRRSSGGWWRWWGRWGAVKGEINQVKAICGNGCCSVIRNPVTQQLLWAVSRRRLTGGQRGILILSPVSPLPPQKHFLTSSCQ